MARKSSGGWRLQSAFWGMVGDRFSLSDLVLLFLYVRRSVAVSSPGFRRFAALAQAVLGYGGCLSSVFEPEYPPPSVVCAGGFLYHGGHMGGLKSGRLCPLEWPFTLLPHLWPSSLRFLYWCALFQIPFLLRQVTALASPISVRRFSATTSVWWFSGH
ncbi:hypothetical protein HID58_030171 [Brassica napus]|uniref:Uncharacterized protein n=1 Tax=Brassica napus TaxID=3708 RepID=A0ABQ8CF81_BRANA|nr:hypothetical protein HID58_030171 [Brassica napus]